MSTILLAGCGKVGQALGERLQQLGHHVVGLRRSIVDMPFTMLQVDLSQPIPPGTLPNDVEYVIYTATPSERSDFGYQQAYPIGVNNLLKSLKSAPLKRFILVSSTAVYHQNDGSWVDEQSPTQPTKFNGIRVLEAETLLTQANIPSTCVRFGGIYGEGRNWLMRKALSGAEAQTKPPKYTNRIHQQDCVGVLTFLIEQSENRADLANCYIAVDDEPAEEAKVLYWLAEQLNGPTPTAIENQNPQQNKRCSNNRLKTAGYTFLYPSYQQGYRNEISSSQGGD